MAKDRFGHLPRRIADAHHASGPVSFLNPTTRYLKVPAKSAAADVNGVNDVNGGEIAPAQAAGEPPASAAAAAGKQHVDGAYQIWRSRDNRKGRHAIVLTSDFLRSRQHGKEEAATSKSKPVSPVSPVSPAALPRSSSSLRGVLHGLFKMLVRYPVWDVSYDVAIIFTIGSVVWVVNSFFVWLPLAAPSTAFSGEETWAGGVSALVGATIFEVGAVLGMLEAVNENREDCFGWALEEALESGMLSLRPNPDDCRHGHVDHARLLGRSRARRHHHDSLRSGSGSNSESDESAADTPETTAKTARARRRWTWFPTAHELRTVYAREMGFWSCAIQLLGATVFWISGLTGLPPIFSRLSTAAADGIFWLPQVVGGIGFIVSSAMFMLETQHKWYVPAPRMLGWHIGFWNLVGAVGFTLCGALGFGATTSDAVEYALTMSTFVGSWAFLIGSIIQWYESLDKYTIQIRDSLPSHVPL